MTLRPLLGVRVVDATTTLGGSLCGKLLRDAGAEVARLVLPGAEEIARVPPEGSWPSFLDLDKDLVDATLAEVVLHDSHVLLSSERHASGPFACDEALKRFPDLLVACVTGFGQSGRYARFTADDVVLSALCGLTDSTPGLPDRSERPGDPPVQSLAPLAEVATGLYATCAVLGALMPRLAGRPGPRHVEVAALEAAVAMTVYEWGLSSYGGVPFGRRPDHLDLEPNVYLQCRDGELVVVAITPRQWEGLVDMLGSPSWAKEPRFAAGASRAAHWPELHQRLREWAGQRAGRDVLEDAQARGVPCALALELCETLVEPHLHAIGALRHARGRTYPADPIRVNGQRRPAPAKSENATGRGQWRRPSDNCAASPLHGIRVVDLGQYAAGPYCGQLLAALGADVIVVESATGTPITRQFGPFGGEPTWDASANFNHCSRGKRSVRLDLKSEGGRRVFRDLVASSDVVVENFSRSAAERLGLTYEELAHGRDDLILASITGFGPGGPWSDYVGLHSTLICLSGMASVTRDAKGRMRLVGAVIPDLLTGTMTALAVQEALAERARTGCGVHVEVAMLDVLLTAMGGLVPIAAGGTIFSSHPARFSKTVDDNGFLAHRDAIDDLTDVAQLSKREAMAFSQANGRAVGAVLDLLEVMNDPHLRNDRGFVVEDDHPVTAGRSLPAVPWLWDGSRPVLRHAPCLGEHTDEVVRELDTGSITG